MTDQTDQTNETDQTIQPEEMFRDYYGEPVAVAAAQAEIRAAMGDSTDETLAANAEGRIHPSQQARVEQWLRRRAGVIIVLWSAPVVVALCVALPVGLYHEGGDDTHPGVAVVIVALTLVASALVATLVIHAPGRQRIHRAHGPITAAGESATAISLLRLDGRALKLRRDASETRWIGQSLVAYRLDSGVIVPLYLSGDLVLPPVGAFTMPRAGRPAPDPIAAAPLAEPPLASGAELILPAESRPAWWRIRVTGEDRIVSTVFWSVVAAGVVVPAFVWIQVAVASANIGARAVAFAFPGVALALTCLGPFAIREAVRESRATYVVDDGPDGQPTLTVDRPPGAGQHSATALTRIVEERTPRVGRDDAIRWTFEFGPDEVLIPGPPGAIVARALRAVRPDIRVSAYKYYVDGSGSGGS